MCLPVDEVLKFLHGLRLPISPTGENLSAVVHSDDAIRCVNEKAAVKNKEQKREVNIR